MLLFILVVVSAVVSKVSSVPIPSPSSCKDNHATCTEGDSLRRLQDLLVSECDGVEPAANETVAMEALNFTLPELKWCQDNLVEVTNCAKELHHNMSSNATQHDQFCQGLERLKMMNSIVQRQMCPDLETRAKCVSRCLGMYPFLDMCKMFKELDFRKPQ